jgi:hypothetical protein
MMGSFCLLLSFSQRISVLVSDKNVKDFFVKVWEDGSNSTQKHGKKTDVFEIQANKNRLCDGDMLRSLLSSKI